MEMGGIEVLVFAPFLRGGSGVERGVFGETVREGEGRSGGGSVNGEVHHFCKMRSTRGRRGRRGRRGGSKGRIGRIGGRIGGKTVVGRRRRRGKEGGRRGEVEEGVRGERTGEEGRGFIF